MNSASAEATTARVGCIVCRSRKVRCDKTLPSCRNCARLGVACPGYNREHQALPRKDILKSTEAIFRAAGKEKRRIGSCEPCRASKEHCTQTRPSCRRCTLRGLSCGYRSTEKGAHSSPRDSSPCGSLDPERRTIVVSGLHIDYVQLCSGTLPSDSRLRNRLIDSYFERIHPVGWMGFIHKPSFMQALDRDTVIEDYGESTLYMICALGARLVYNDSIQSHGIKAVLAAEIPGQAWVEKARKHVLLAAHAPTVPDLMAMILLCDYALQTNQHALVFILSGCLFRAIRLLGLDTAEQPTTQTGLEFVKKETENRIVWAAYHIDLLIASGVDKHSSWRDDFPRIPLPRSNQDFLALSSGRPYFLDPLDKLAESSTIKTLDLPALTAVVFRLRSTVLRLIRTTPDEGSPIWNSFSPFMSTLRKLEFLHLHIPDRFRLTELNMYTHKDQHILGAVFLLHLLLHAAVFDLTRLSLAGFSFPLAAGFHGAPTFFVEDCQKRCQYHANKISTLIRTGFTHKAIAFDHPLCAGIVLESAKIKIVHSATIPNSPETLETTKQNLRTDLELLEFMYTGKEEQSPVMRVILSLCMLFGFQDIAHEWRGAQVVHDESTFVTGSADSHHLSNFASFRMAKAEVQTRKSNTAADTSPSALARSSRISGSSEARRASSGLNSRGRVLLDHEELMQGSASRDSQSHHAPNEIALHTSVGEYETEQAPSVEDYIRTAESMCEYLAWDSVDTWQLWELPP